MTNVVVTKPKDLTVAVKGEGNAGIDVETSNALPSHKLSGHSDADFLNATNNQQLRYNEATDKWESFTFGLGTYSLGELGNVTESNLLNNQQLRYNAVAGEYENFTFSLNDYSLGDIGDVDVSVASNRKLLEYDSTTESWKATDDVYVNKLTIGTGSFVGDLNNVSLKLGHLTGAYVDSNRLFFVSQNVFSGGFAGGYLIGNGVSILMNGGGTLTTPAYRVYRTTTAGNKSGLGGDVTGSISIITDEKNRLMFNSEGDITMPEAKTFELPMHTTIERDALTGIDSGKMIYNTTKNKPEYYNGSAWVEM